MADDAISIAYNEQLKKLRESMLIQARNEEKNITYQSDLAASISSFGVSEDNPLNVIRIHAGAAMTSINSVLNPSGLFKAIKTPFEIAETFGNGMQDLLTSLISLDRMIMYQMQRVQNYRMNQTLGAISSLCADIHGLNSAVHEIANSFGSESNLDMLVDDWTWRFDSALEIIDNAYDEENDFLDDEWKDGEAILSEVTSGSYRDDKLVDDFRRFSNAINEAREKYKRLGDLRSNLSRYLKDSQGLLENIKVGLNLEKMLKRAIQVAKQDLKDGKNILESLQGGCRYDQNNVFISLGTALSRADAALISLSKAKFDDKFSDIDPETIDTTSDCILVRYDAYLDDLALLELQTPDYDAIDIEQTDFIDSAISYAANGTSQSKTTMDDAKEGIEYHQNTCDTFSSNASDVFDGWDEASTDAGEGMMGILGDIADRGDSTNAALDMILGAQAFTLDSYEDFLRLTPVGRMLILVSECLGVSSELLSAESLDDFSEVRAGLDSMTESIAGISQEIAQTMNSIFGFLDQIDSDVAEFIAALAGLLKFCDGQTLLSNPGTYGTDMASQMTMEINSTVYNSALGQTNNGVDEQVAEDPDIGGCLR